MRIIIDTVWQQIHEWDSKTKSKGKLLYSAKGVREPTSFQSIVCTFLTDSQQKVFSERDSVFKLSKKKQAALLAAIKKATE